MLRAPRRAEDPDVRLRRDTAGHLLPRLAPAGLGVGLLSGFFGIGGGFLIVPALMAATAMPMRNAIGTSLVAVAAFGLTTATSYAFSGFVDWWLVAILVAGGVAGTTAGIFAGRRLAAHKALLRTGFGALVIAVGLFVASKPFL